jgi:protein-S-isoprenylcysteine O-methyltransferase Ste14
VVGYALLAIGMFISAWAGSVNKFAEPTVRIQTDRGHKVIDTGPYAIVRHPGYVAAFFLFSGIALALGSLWALIPAAVASLLLVVRTQLEDRTLQNELEGYKEYAKRVGYRLIPGIW